MICCCSRHRHQRWRRSWRIAAMPSNGWPAVRSSCWIGTLWHAMKRCWSRCSACWCRRITAPRRRTCGSCWIPRGSGCWRFAIRRPPVASRHGWASWRPSRRAGFLHRWQRISGEVSDGRAGICWRSLWRRMPDIRRPPRCDGGGFCASRYIPHCGGVGRGRACSMRWSSRHGWRVSLVSAPVSGPRRGWWPSGCPRASCHCAWGSSGMRPVASMQ